MLPLFKRNWSISICYASEFADKQALFRTLRPLISTEKYFIGCFSPQATMVGFLSSFIGWHQKTTVRCVLPRIPSFRLATVYEPLPKSSAVLNFPRPHFGFRMRLQLLRLGEKSLPMPSSKSQNSKASAVKIMLMHMTLKYKRLNLVTTTFNLPPTGIFKTNVSSSADNHYEP